MGIFPRIYNVLGIALAVLTVSASVCVVLPSLARAESLEILLPYVIENHDRVRAEKERLTAARNRAREALGKWYPTLSQTANFGHERQQNDNGSDSSTGFNEWDVSLTQLLWDFGSTNSAIDKARLKVEEARYNLISARQSLILEAISAYMNVIRTHSALGFARESEDNIRRQTGLEEAMVMLGSGFSTDVLQAKTQLAGAQARLAQNDGGLITALNRYKAVFGRTPDNIDELEPVPYPASYLPHSLTQAVDVALEINPKLKNAILAADIAQEDSRIARADNFFPKIEASGERKFKKNVGGTIGSEQETLAKVEMTFDFNLGFTAVNTLRAANSDLSATTFTAADTRRNIEEQVRNAWQQLDTATRTSSHLGNQANIAAAFLELARNERQLGRRSLIDVLSGETNLINSKSDALSAETDVLIAAYGLLAATGQLEYDVVKGSHGVKPPQLSPMAPAAKPAPVPAPSIPVMPAPNGQQGRIEPDTQVAAGRSVHDLQMLFTAADNAQPRRGPSPPAFPPKVVLAAPLTPDEFEFASIAPPTGYQTPDEQTLPAYSDTPLSSTPLVVAVPLVDRISMDKITVAVTDTSSAPTTEEIATVPEGTSPKHEAVPVPDRNPFVHLFADIGNLIDSADRGTVTTPGTAMQPTPVTTADTAPDARKEIAAIAVDAATEPLEAASAAVAETATPHNPFVHLFSDIQELFDPQSAIMESQAELAVSPTPVPTTEPGPVMTEIKAHTPAPETEVASLAQAKDVHSNITPDTNPSNPFADIYAFFEEAAEKRKLADSSLASVPVEASSITARPLASVHPVEDALNQEPRQELPTFFAAFVSLFEVPDSDHQIDSTGSGDKTPDMVHVSSIQADIAALGR